MLSDFIVTFPTTDEQLELIRRFCVDKKDCNYFISVRQLLPDNDQKLVLSISMFAYKPDIYIGIYSADKDSIVEDVTIDTETLGIALEALSGRYIHAMTREIPVINEKLAVAWMKYFNAHINDNLTKYPIGDL